MQDTHFRMLACALVAFAASGPALAGPKQAAAESACRATFQEQHRGCQQVSNPQACVHMYEEKLGQCLSDAASVVGLSTPTDPTPPKTKMPKVNAPAAASAN